MKNSKEIRQALIQIAERKGRPHYSLEVVRSVIHAIQNNLDHPLKDEVVVEKVLFVTEACRDVRLDELITFCNRTGMREILARNAGVTVGIVSRILNGIYTLTDAMWIRLSGAFDDSNKEYRYKRDTRKRTSARDWSVHA